ncbi:MAG: hypothetical protein Q8R37_02290 [Nanoarchaeota archaeon]|nr:hypothetical protein [Nanoarchaeota archaeon]
MKKLSMVILLLALCLLLAACTKEETAASGKAADKVMEAPVVPAPSTAADTAAKVVPAEPADVEVEEAKAEIVPKPVSVPVAGSATEMPIETEEVLTAQEVYEKVHEFEEIALDLLGEGIITEEQFANFAAAIDQEIDAIDTARNSEELNTIVAKAEQHWIELMKEVQK